MPLQVSPHPVQSPFILTLDEFQSRHVPSGPLIGFVPSRTPLVHHDRLTFNSVPALQLVLDVRGRAPTAQCAHHSLDLLHFEVVERHLESIITSAITYATGLARPIAHMARQYTYPNLSTMSPAGHLTYHLK